MKKDHYMYSVYFFSCKIKQEKNKLRKSRGIKPKKTTLLRATTELR